MVCVAFPSVFVSDFGKTCIVKPAHRRFIIPSGTWMMTSLKAELIYMYTMDCNGQKN